MDAAKFGVEIALFLISILLGIIGWFLKKENERTYDKLKEVDKSLETHRNSDTIEFTNIRNIVTAEVSKLKEEFSQYRERATERFVHKDDYVREQIQTDSRISSISKNTESLMDKFLDAIDNVKGKRGS